MGPSFGLAKLVTDHPSYNVGIGLPFVIAFYLANDSHQYVVPLIDYAIGPDLSALITIISVAFYYICFSIFFLFCGSFSAIGRESNYQWIFPAFIVFLSIIGWSTVGPKIGLVFGVMAAIFLVFHRYDDGSLSISIIAGIGGLTALCCFVAGIMWYSDVYLFADAVAWAFGFEQLSPASLKQGWPMLITVGYAVYYSVFQAGRLRDDMGY